MPLTFVILNNGRYAALQDFAPVFGYADGDKPAGTDLPGLDFVALAKGHGLPGTRVDNAADLRSALSQALAHPSSNLIEVVVA